MSENRCGSFSATKVVALIALMALVVIMLLFFLHDISFNDAIVLLVGDIVFLLSAERLVT